MLIRAAMLSSLLLLIGCKGDGYLRGEVRPSDDGKTYFAVLDDAGGNCGSIYINDIKWPQPIDEYREVKPGNYSIKCGVDDSGILFEIPAGVKFGFDYWGP